jgi:hypothetical protein
MLKRLSQCPDYSARLLGRCAALASLILWAAVLAIGLAAQETRPAAWASLPSFEMRGGLKVFWDVSDGSNGENGRAAAARGFTPLTLLSTYADYPGNKREDIGLYVGKGSRNPWNKPPYFERIIRRNIQQRGTSGTFVNDIEIGFEEDAAKAWKDPLVRALSAAPDFPAFEEAYFREWATWYSLPLMWTKQIFPTTKVGVYGPQPFRRDYWGISGKNAQQIDGTHASDARLWRYIDPFADFYIASIYVFYNDPASVYYMAANVEENYQRTRSFGDKPLYAYTWMRFHDSNWREAGRELEPYLVEAMAIVPFFSGAKGVVLWGAEPKLKAADGQPYRQMPTYLAAIGRVAKVSEEIGRSKLVVDEAAHVSWNAKRPLIRRVVLPEGTCIVMAANPWQSDAARTSVDAECGGKKLKLTVEGKHVALYRIAGGNASPL